MEASPTFPQSSRLPKDIRLMVWKHSLPDPRIVYLKRELLRTDGLDWWERVRSDRAIGPRDKSLPFCQTVHQQEIMGPDDSEVADEQDTKDEPVFIEDILATAPESALALGEEWEDEAVDLRYLQFLEIQADNSERRNSSRARWSFGLRSYCEIPAVLICRESHYIASKTYTRTFGRLGALPQTYFDFKRHAFLSAESLFEEPLPFNYQAYSDYIQQSFLLGDLGQAQSLAIVGSSPISTAELALMLSCFTSLKILTMVRSQLVYDEGFCYNYEYDRNLKEFAKLRFMNLEPQNNEKNGKNSAHPWIQHMLETIPNLDDVWLRPMIASTFVGLLRYHGEDVLVDFQALQREIDQLAPTLPPGAPPLPKIQSIGYKHFLTASDEAKVNSDIDAWMTSTAI